MFPIDCEVSKKSLFDVGVGRFCGRLDGETGQHQRGHNQKERKQRKSLSLFPYGIEESPFTQVHFSVTSFLMLFCCPCVSEHSMDT